MNPENIFIKIGDEAKKQGLFIGYTKNGVLVKTNGESQIIHVYWRGGYVISDYLDLDLTMATGEFEVKRDIKAPEGIISDSFVSYILDVDPE